MRKMVLVAALCAPGVVHAQWGANTPWDILSRQNQQNQANFNALMQQQMQMRQQRQQAEAEARQQEYEEARASEAAAAANARDRVVGLIRSGNCPGAIDAALATNDIAYAREVAAFCRDFPDGVARSER